MDVEIRTYDSMLDQKALQQELGNDKYQEMFNKGLIVKTDSPEHKAYLEKLEGGGGADPNGGGNPNGGDPNGGQLPVPGADQNEIINNWAKQTFNQDVDALKQRFLQFDELQGKVKKTESLLQSVSNPFSNEDISRLNSLVREVPSLGVDAATKIISFNSEHASPEEVLMLKYRLEGVTGSDSDLLELVREEYGYTEEEGKGSYSKAAKFRIDTSSAVNKIKDAQSKAVVFDPQKSLEEVDKTRQQQVQQLGQAIQGSVVNVSLRGIKTSVKLSEDNKDVVDVEIPSNYIREKGKFFADNAGRFALDSSKPIEPQIKGMIENSYWLENRDSILKNAILQDRVNRDKTVNPGNIDRSLDGGQNGKLSLGQQLLANREANRQKRR